MAAGAAFDIVPYGMEALGVLRIEKGHVAGPELDGRTTARDLGLGRMLSTRKAFIGQKLMARPGLADPKRPALVGLMPVESDARLRGGAHLVENPQRASGETCLGHVTSVANSPTLGHWIALALVAGGAARLGPAAVRGLSAQGRSRRRRRGAPGVRRPRRSARPCLSRVAARRSRACSRTAGMALGRRMRPGVVLAERRGLALVQVLARRGQDEARGGGSGLDPAPGRASRTPAGPRSGSRRAPG